MLGDNMLRVFIDSSNEVDNKDVNGVNIQTFSFSNLFKKEDSLNKIKQLLLKYSNDNDSIILLCSLNSYNLVNNSLKNLLISNYKVINCSITKKGIDLIINQIIKHQDSSLDEIERRIKTIIEIHEVACYIVFNPII